ncbi:SpoIIE family protein phosphatase [Bernardetia sp. Wsw4-3y2]|uniref:SpoIIE family protein phosphatase n=1 Tax=Bernardetia sp. Wsw4-3y2 TaxID=3127471 RepID=UPI0030CC96FE
MKPFFFIILFYCFVISSFAQKFDQSQELQDIGTPFIDLFSPKDYNGHPQIWSIEQDNNGMMYFGGKIVYTYDGVAWRSIVIPNSVVVRTLGRDATGKIYVGTRNDFGYLAPSDSTSEMEYFSLTQNLNDSIKEFGDVWDIKGNDSHVYFLTTKQVFIYNLKTKKLTNTPVLGTTLRGLLHQGNYYFHNTEGIGFINPTIQKTQQLANTDTLKKFTLSGVLSYSPTELLFLSQPGEIWKYDLSTQSISYFPTEIDTFIQNNPPTIVYHAITLKNGNILISTIFKGAFLIDRQGKLIKKIDKSIGLPTQTIPYAFEDQNENIWLALDAGIAKLELKTPFRFFEEEKAGFEGVVLSIKKFNGILYIGTTKGLFYKNEANIFVKIEGLNGFCWDIKTLEINGEKHLYAITQDNLFHVTPQKALPIIESNSANVFEQLSPNKAILAGRGGFTVMQFEEPTKTQLIQKGVIEGAQVRTIAILENEVWLGTIQEGLYKVSYTSDSLNTTDIFHVDSIPTVDKSSELSAWVYNNDLLVGSTKGFYTFNSEKNTFELHSSLKNTSKKYSVFRFTHTPNDEFYLVGTSLNDKVNLIGADENGKRQLIQTPFLRLPVMSTQSIYYDDENTLWIGGSEGLYRYYPQKAESYKYNKISKPIIRKVFLGEDSLFFGGNYANSEGLFLEAQPKEAQPTFIYDNNSLTFHFAATIFQEGVEYSYKLEGYDKEFSNWTTESKKSYTNLYEGNYTFKVKTKNIYNVESEITTYSFKILPPWFRAWWAYLIYVVVGALGVWGLIWINTQRLKKANQRLEDTVKERTAELMESNEEIVQQNFQLNQQKEEIEAQNENQKELNISLSIQKEEVEKAHKNVQLLAEIGQEITAILNFEDLIKSVYHNVNALMPADGFGIGIFDGSQNKIGFQGFIEKGEKLPYHFDSLQENTLAIRCFKKLEEIIINDLETEGEKYDFQLAEEQQGEIPLSLVYLPLQLENKPLGVITVQSFKKNSYSERELTFLRSLASYVSIALDNSSAYQLINEKNQKITDSIRYAQTIQQAILPSEKKIEKPFRLSNEDYQIIFRPKDIVSGDFYWTSQTTDYFFVAAVDCTGHGVPGAFMSMIGNTLLTEIVEIQKIYEPSLILDKFNEQFVEALRQDENANSDGMDVCLCRVNFDNKKTEIVFAGAKRPLFYTDYNENQENKIQRLQGTRKSVGGKQRNQNNFEQHILLLNKKSRIYLSTDGLPDQNNPQGEKIGTSKLIYLIEQSSHLSIKEQIKEVENELVKHQQNAEQRDDITFIGIEV